MGMDITSGWGILPLPSVVKPQPVDEVLMEATVRRVRNVNGDSIKEKVWGGTGKCEQALREVVVSLLPDCTMGMNTVSDMEMSFLSSTIEKKACKSALEAVLIGHTKWEPVRLPEPTRCGRDCVCVWGGGVRWC